MLTLEERKAAHAAIIRSSSVDDGNLKVGICDISKSGAPLSIRNFVAGWCFCGGKA